MQAIFQRISRFVNAEFDSAMFFLYMFFYVICYSVASGLYAAFGQWGLAAIPFAGVFISIISTLIHIKGMKRPAALLRTISTTFIIFVTSYYSGGINAFPITFLSGAALGAYLVVGKTAGFLVASLSMVLMSVTYALKIPPSVLNESQMHLAAIVVQCINIPFVVMVGAIYGARADVFRLKSESEKHKALKAHQKTGAVMDAIRGAILSVNADYEITEKNQISDLTFGNFTGFRDVLSQIEVEKPAELREALASILGEDVLNFEANELCLSTSGTIRGRRHFITWKPLVDAEERVQELVVAFIDNEEELKAKERAVQSDIINSYMGILADLEQEKSLSIITTFSDAIAKSRQAISQGEHQTAFRELHTIKGVARALKFDSVASKIHDTESALANPPEALSLLGDVEREFDRIRSAAKKLKFDGNHIKIDKSVIDRALRDRTERDLILSLKYTTFQALLESFRHTLPEEARKRSKPTPQLVIDTPKIHLVDEAMQQLGRTFVHIFSNALDHGIETPEVRTAQNKSPQGTITVRAVVADKLVIRVSDDGAGLAIARIFDKAKDKGLVDSTLNYSPSQKAAFIFESEFSTKENVTETAGRGVGMDAVKASITGIGGRVSAEVFSAEDMAPWELVLELPLHCLVRDSRTEDPVLRAG